MHATHRTGLWLAIVTMAISVFVGQTLAAQLGLSVGKAVARGGQVAKLPINAETKVAIGALQLDLMYDPEVLTFKAIDNGPLATSALVESNVIAPGVLRVALAGNGEIKGNGTLLNVEFQVNSGDARTVDLSLAKARSWDHADNLEMTVETHGGEFRRGGPDLGISLWIFVAGGAVAFILLVLVFRRKSRREA